MKKVGVGFSDKLKKFKTESVWSEFTELSKKHNSVNLGQGKKIYKTKKQGFPSKI